MCIIYYYYYYYYYLMTSHCRQIKVSMVDCNHWRFDICWLQEWFEHESRVKQVSMHSKHFTWISTIMGQVVLSTKITQDNSLLMSTMIMLVIKSGIVVKTIWRILRYKVFLWLQVFDHSYIIFFQMFDFTGSNFSWTAEIFLH